MESFFLEEGMTLIRSFEAGARTTMMHDMMGGTLPIETLVKETAKGERIAYISIVTEDGTVIASAGSHDTVADIALTRRILKTREPVTTMVEGGNRKAVFEVAAIFQSLPGERSSMMTMMGSRRWNSTPLVTKMLEEGRAVIHLGLCTEEYLQARQQDINHSFFMGGLLLLVGTAGFYFLFLYQGMLVTRTTLTNMELYTKNIIESMPDGLMTFDSKKRVVGCNPKALEFIAMDIETLMGMHMDELFPDRSMEVLEKQNDLSSFMYTFSNTKGVEVPVEISRSSLHDKENNDRGSVFLLRDLRKIRAMEEQLVRSHRLAALGRMAAGIAHEIRNPLGTLRGFAQYFRAKADDEASIEYSSLMIGEVDRLNESISFLLEFSRPRDPELVRLDTTELLEKSCKLLEHDLAEKKISLQKSYRCTVPVEADGDLLLQVLLNLLKNAINASEMGSTVSLVCENNRDKIYITVTDNGIGMSKNEREQMFDPFFTTRKTGTGLGLTVSHQIVEQHSGTLEVDSEPGRGTSITMILPIKQNGIADEKNINR